jgi:hypothetical protein
LRKLKVSLPCNSGLPPSGDKNSCSTKLPKRCFSSFRPDEKRGISLFEKDSKGGIEKGEEEVNY